MQMLDAVRELLVKNIAHTQEDIRLSLETRGLTTTQSTISRALKRLKAVRAIGDDGRVVYRLPTTTVTTEVLDSNGSLSNMLQDIRSNGSLIVMHTTPGSASLLARLLDEKKPAGILGTIAGDDTVFIAPASAAGIPATIDEIKNLLA